MQIWGWLSAGMRRREVFFNTCTKIRKIETLKSSQWETKTWSKEFYPRVQTSRHEDLQQADMETKITHYRRRKWTKVSVYSPRISTPCSHVQKIGESPRCGVHGCKRQPLTSLHCALTQRFPTCAPRSPKGFACTSQGLRGRSRKVK